LRFDEVDKAELLGRTKAFSLRTETLYWLELIRESKSLAESKISDLLREADELTAIFTAGRRTTPRSNIKAQTSNLP
jgi:hypothetical protein